MKEAHISGEIFTGAVSAEENNTVVVIVDAYTLVDSSNILEIEVAMDSCSLQ